MRILVALLLASAAMPAFAQEPAVPPAQEEPPADPAGGASAGDEAAAMEEFGEDIVVTGRRPRGSVIGDIAPEVTLNPRDIRGYGASNLAELLEALSPLTASVSGRDGGQPVTLVNGRRISSFREIRDLPPEAVVRVEVLPEEVALKYGYRADQKVVNFVLRRRFRAVTAELEAGGATDGGRQQYEADLNYVRIQGPTRFSIDGEYERQNPLFETQRDIDAADPDRTLLAASDKVELETSYAHTIFGNVAAAVTGGIEGEDSRAALGRSLDASARLQRDRRTRQANLGLAANGDLAPSWLWSLTGGYDRAWSTTLTDRDRDDGSVGRDRAESTTNTLNAEAVVNGRLATLPEGPLSATFTLGGDSLDFSSESDRAGLITATDLGRDRARGRANIDVPVLDGVTLSANGAVEELSDFGTLTTVGGTLNWRPANGLRVIASYNREDGAPSVNQLGDPVLVTPNVRVLDLTTGETVDVTQVEGGNPDLLADSRRVLRASLQYEPIRDTDLTLLAAFSDIRTDNPTAGLPAATPEIEAAFPDRFTRDADGTLLRIDSRPVNFARSQRRQVRYGFNWSETLEGPEPTPEERARREQMREARQAGGPPGESRRRFGRGGGGGGGRGFGGGGGGRTGRINVSLFHTWRLEDTVLIRDGVPELDLLDGSATGARGGQPRHTVELDGGYNRNGLGARLNLEWQSGTRVRADPGGAASPDDLRFGSLTTINLRLFADLGAQRGLVRDHPFFRGSRVTFAVDNLLNDRLDVRDASGAVPLGYQPDLLDPLGRTVRISFRKLFF